MAYFVGIDGGGTKTECVLGDESSVLSRTVGPTCKIQVVGAQAAKAVLHGVIRFVCAEAGIKEEEISRVCIGMSGASKLGVGAALTAMVWELAPAHVEVVGDNVVAMNAAFGTSPGVLIIAGTGSIAYGRNGNGTLTRVGGWGPAISDEGSGAWIGRHALAAMMRAVDRGENTALEQLITDLWQVRSREDLATMANQQQLTQFGKLLQVVLAASKTGDSVAVSVLSDAGAHLAHMVADVMQQLWPDPQPEPIPVAMSGGVLRNSELVRRAFQNSLTSMRSDADILPTVVDPGMGALDMARSATSKAFIA